MEAISEKLGSVVKRTVKGSHKKGAAALWKKFAAGLEGAAKTPAKTAALAPNAPQPTPLTEKSDAQLQFLKTVLNQVGTPRPSLAGDQENGQLRKPQNPIPHPHLIKQETQDPASKSQAKPKERTPGSERLDAMLQLLALNLDNVSAKKAEAVPTKPGPSSAGGTTLAAAVAKPQATSGKIEFDPTKLMTGRAGEVLQPGKGGNITEVLKAMGIDPTQMAPGVEPGVKAALLELRNRAEAKHSVALPEKKGRSRAPGETARPKTVRPRAEGPALESVKVEHRWERLKERLNGERNPSTEPARPERPERRPNPITASEPASAANRAETMSQGLASGDGNRFAKAIDRAAAKIERRYTEEHRRRQAEEPETATAKSKQAPRPEAGPVPPRTSGDDRVLASQVPNDLYPDIEQDFTSTKPIVKSGPDQVPVGPLPQPGPNALDGLMPSPRETPAPPQPMFSQIEAGLRHAFIVRPKSVTVRLAPEELGELQIKVSIEQDKIQAQIKTESHKVVSILKDHQAELQQRLQQQGIELARFEVRQENNPTQGDAQRQQQAFQGGLDQQGQGNHSGSQRGESGSGFERGATALGEALVNTPSAEPVSIFDANGRLSLTA